MASLASRARNALALGLGGRRPGFVVGRALGNNWGLSSIRNSMSSKNNPGLLARAREERESRDLSIRQMGEVLGLTGMAVEAGAVQGYEAGQEVRNGAVVRIYESLRRARQAQQWLGLPKYTLDASDPEMLVIHHNAFPRFVGIAVKAAQHKEQWRFAKAGMPVYELDPSSGWRQLIVSFVDHVPVDCDPEDAIEEAVRLAEGKL